jgi:hypothetical protein
MRVKLRYGRTVSLRDTPKPNSWQPARVVDDLLALRAERPYLLHVLKYSAEAQAARWAVEGKKQLAPADLTASGEEFARFLLLEPGQMGELMLYINGQTDEPPADVVAVFDELREAFDRAAKDAAAGRTSPELADHLTRVERLEPRTVEVPDIAAFGAWCLELLLEGGPIKLATCELCGYPWLPSRATGHYCQRPAPGRQTTCRVVASVNQYGQAHAKFKNERRRLYERMKRGTLDENEYQTWKRENRPGKKGKDWRDFETWKARRKETTHA